MCKVTSFHIDYTPWATTCWIHLLRKCLIQDTVLSFIPYFNSLFFSMHLQMIKVRMSEEYLLTIHLLLF